MRKHRQAVARSDEGLGKIGDSSRAKVSNVGMDVRDLLQRRGRPNDLHRSMRRRWFDFAFGQLGQPLTDAFMGNTPPAIYLGFRAGNRLCFHIRFDDIEN